MCMESKRSIPDDSTRIPRLPVSFDDRSLSFAGCDVLISTEHAFKHRIPGVPGGNTTTGFCSSDFQVCLAQCFDRVCQRFRRVFVSPARLISKNDSVHITAPNPNHWGTTGLALQSDQSECFLHTWMNEKVGCPVDLRERFLLRTVSKPSDRLGLPLQHDQMISIVTI